MPNLGNAWHIPASPEPRGRAGMRDPVGTLVPGAAITVFSGNQFQGGGNPGNQLQVGSSLLFKRRGDTGWTSLPLLFQAAAGNNKYFAATIPAGTFKPGDAVDYYLRIAYDDHATTFLRAAGATSSTTADEPAAQSQPFTFTVESSAARGEWSAAFPLPNAAIHAHVLANGLVLMWGRRDRPDLPLDDHECTPFLWNPSTRQVTTTPQPTLADGTKINLFCSGHAFLADGRLLVVGGHLFDSQGLTQATTYDPAGNTWTPTALMNDGRWYPTATTLSDGRVLALSGSFLHQGQIANNLIPQVWADGSWIATAPFPDGATFELFPRVHAASDGSLFMSGPLVESWSLSVSNGGRWAPVARRDNARRDYCPSVMYDVDKVIYIGGGNEPATHEPTANAETIDLGASPRRWRATQPMRFPRRQHNATILADGTVLVTGGTRGGGGPGPNPMGFNDLGPGQPVHVAELWDPATGRWSELAAEQVDRCYHATAVLLPDATVLSAGGGEYRPIEGRDTENDPEDTHRDAQIFSPPYLFKGPRPEIRSAPESVIYGATFDVAASAASDIAMVTWIRLSSVTHSFNMNQRINFLPFAAAADTLRVTAPASPKLCPPGHYMLFILSRAGVPSIAKVVRIMLPAGAPAGPVPGIQAGVSRAGATAPAGPKPLDAFARRAAILGAATGTAVVVGITGTCPYGLGACWAGAHEALRSLEGVEHVDPIPDAEHASANVFLAGDGLPALDRWDDQFRRMVNGSYELRGVEVRLAGRLEARDGELFLAGGAQRPAVQLARLVGADKIQWNRAAGTPEAVEPDEASAYERLAAGAGEPPGGGEVAVTGPLKLTAAGYRLEVRIVTSG